MSSSQQIFLGGSFNPIHYGHLITAKAVAQTLAYEHVLLIPAWVSPLKQTASAGASAEDRCHMCRLAAEEDSLFVVDDLEIQRGGASYTIDTVQELKRRGIPQVHWLIGADQLMDLPRWKDPQLLLREVRFVIMRRPGSEIDWTKLPPEYRFLQECLVDAPLVDISGTDIRRRVKAGESIDGLTPPKVASYIQTRGLYRSIT